MPDLMSQMEILFATFPPLPGATSEEGFKAAMRAYGIALEGYGTGDIEAGIGLIVAGRFSDHDGRYAPTAPQLARAVRQARDDRLDQEKRDKPQLLLTHYAVKKALSGDERVAFVRKQLARLGKVMPDLRVG